MLMSDIDPIKTARELATHANDIVHLQSDMDKMVEEMKQIKEAVQSIQKTLDTAHGGWRTLMMVGGAFAVIGAIFANLLQGIWSK
jgi:tetrahydromethanopterin S-methyltransferase subunit B